MNERRRKNDDSDMDIELHMTIQRLSDQMERFVSDIESEKGTRARMNSDFLRQIELLRSDLKNEYATKQELKTLEVKFSPVKQIVFIIITAILTGLVSAWALSITKASDPPSYRRDGGQEQIVPELQK